MSARGQVDELTRLRVPIQGESLRAARIAQSDRDYKIGEMGKGSPAVKAHLTAQTEHETVHCCIAAHEVLCASAETIAHWRREPIELAGEKLPATFLKHAEDQTIAGLHAVIGALKRQGWQDRSFADWGVIAGPSLCGRVTIAQAIERFQQEGAWGVSPHLIPHQSLHALSGMISQALKIHGPNFGVNGGPNPACDALLIGMTMLAEGVLPGLWVVLTGHEAEWIPVAGKLSPAPRCHAVALALIPEQLNAEGVRLSIGQADDLAGLPEFAISELAGLDEGRWRLSETHWLQLAARRAA
jgi:hypothetical protein